MCKTNLFHANSLSTKDDDFSKGKILDGVRHGLRDYLKYIEKSIKVVQDQGAIKIPVRKEIVKTEIKTEYFDKNQKQIETEIRYYLDIDNLGDKRTKKIESELFEKDLRNVYSQKPNGDRNKDKSIEIKIINRNEEDKYLVLYTEDDLKYIYLKANDYQLRKQEQAVKTLMFQPKPEHTPLQKLFDKSNKAKDYFENNYEPLDYEPDWKVLTEPQKYDGTDEQQNFVKKALQTKDFALLEGPPGSGKTTAIIELIIQLIKQNKRVLLVSATHVAVDNVIHRILTNNKDVCQDLVVPIRISSDKGSIRKESVEPYRLQTFIKTKKIEIRNNLSKKLTGKSQKTLYNSLTDTDKTNRTFDDIILKSANLVGGTMIGILQHPDIKNGNINEMFDVMIVDESSKVTFLDFLVPALYAKKWILVGDVNQLSPYTEDDFINENIDANLSDKNQKQNLVKSFEIQKRLKSKKHFNKESMKILFSNSHTKNYFSDYQVFEMDNYFKPTVENILDLNGADVVICQDTEEARRNIANHVFVKSLIFEGSIEQTNFQNRQKYFHKNTGKNRNFKHYPFESKNDNNQEWKEMVGSRLSLMYQYRFETEIGDEIKKEYDLLVPDEIQNDVENIRKIALPSILELLQIGVGDTYDSYGNNLNKVIYKGFCAKKDKPKTQIEKLKFQSLTYQHRMHNEIASISRDYFYTDNNNLKTANTVFERKDILHFHKPNENKVIWVSNNDNTFRKNNKKGRQENINPTEVRHIKQELINFIEKAKHNPKINKDTQIIENYEIAVITFYREQERELKKMLQELTKQKKKSKYFTINNANVNITLSTVDKFQGDEADMVLLSFTKFTKKAFYNSPNRLNVSLTRAKYKLVLFGNQGWLAKNAQLKGLKKLAESEDENGNSKQNTRLIN